MYEMFLQTLRRFLGGGLVLWTLKVAVPVVVLAVAAWSFSAFRALCQGWRERGGWRALVVTIPTALVKLLMVLLLARVVITAMLLQAENFEHHHGRVTETNRSAVLMKWGYPHHQEELQVWHTYKRTWVTRQLMIPGGWGEKNTVTTESFWKDETPPVQPVDGEVPKVISVREEEREVELVQKSIEEADIQVAVTTEMRTLGGANYAGYRDTWKLRYVVANRSDKTTKAGLRMPLPARAGIFDNMKLLVDNQDMWNDVSTAVNVPGEEAGIKWYIPMKPRQRSVVEFCYEGKGLEYLRYTPKLMTQTGHYRVSITVNNVKAKNLDWCIGSMPAKEKLTEIDSYPVKLTWNLDNALTSYDIGVKLPSPEQPNYHVARLLNQARIGLVLLLVLLIIPRIIAQQPVRISVVALIAAAYYLLYTFMGQLADVVPWFWVSFVLSVIVVTAIVAVLSRRDGGSTLLGRQDLLVFLALAALYPLAVIDSDRTGFWMQFFYLGMLLYACLLVVGYRIVPALNHRRENQ